ncbi:hypothetical protein V6V47_32635, partial [Micromonospora sp. CPCC 205539]
MTDSARAAAPPVAPGPAHLDTAPGAVATPAAGGPRPDPDADRDPRTARRRPGPVDPGAPGAQEPPGRGPADRVRPVAGGRRRAAEPDGPGVPRSGNAPPVPDATTGPTGGTPTLGPTDAPGRRRAAPDEPDRRAPGEPRADRPERPADWLRQAGRLPHTDPGLPVVNRRGGSPPASAADRRPTSPTGDLTNPSRGPLAGPDPAADGPAGRRAGRPISADPTDRSLGRLAEPDPAANGPTGRPGSPPPTADPIRRRRRPAEADQDGPAGPGRPGAPGERGDAPYPGPAVGGRPAPGGGPAGPGVPTRGARSAPAGRARPGTAGDPAVGPDRRAPDGPARPGPG